MKSKVTGRHQKENPNDCNLNDPRFDVPMSVYARHFFPTASKLLEEIEKERGEWSFDDWDKKSGVFLSVLQSLWRQAGRPEINWPTLDGLPSSDSGHCILQAYLDSKKASTKPA